MSKGAPPGRAAQVQPLPVGRPVQAEPRVEADPPGGRRRSVLFLHHGLARRRAGGAVDQPDRMEILDQAVRVDPDPVRGLHPGERAEADRLGGLLVDLPQHAGGRLLRVVQAPARHAPTSGHRGPVGVLRGQQPEVGQDHGVRGDPLSHQRSKIIGEYQISVLTPALGRRAARLFAQRPHQHRQHQITGRVPDRIQRAYHGKTAIMGQHGWIRTMIKIGPEADRAAFIDSNDCHASRPEVTALNRAWR